MTTRNENPRRVRDQTPTGSQAGAEAHDQPARNVDRKSGDQDKLDATQRRHENPTPSRAVNRERKATEMADRSRPAEELQGNEIDREGPICEEPGCEMQQTVEHDGLCPYHRELAEGLTTVTDDERDGLRKDASKDAKERAKK